MGFRRKGVWGRWTRRTLERRLGKVMVAEEIDARRLVLVDEMGTNTSLSPLYAWALKGEILLLGTPQL